jgi:hypothetical protein
VAGLKAAREKAVLEQVADVKAVQAKVVAAQAESPAEVSAMLVPSPLKEAHYYPELVVRVPYAAAFPALLKM